MAAWPAELEELVGLPPFAECLISLEIASLQDFAETFDAEEGHDKVLREALDSLPDVASISGMTEAQRRELAETLESELRWTEGALRSRVAHLVSTSPTRNPAPTTPG